MRIRRSPTAPSRPASAPRPTPAPPASDDSLPSGVELLVAGVFVGPHGVRGDAKLRPLTEFPEELARRKALRVREPGGAIRQHQVLASRWHKGQLLVRLQGIESMEAADALRGAEVVLTREEATPLPPGRYYEHEIIGCRVVTPTGEELGTVTSIMDCAANDVYVAGPWLIPATHDAIIRLAPEEKLIVVRSREYLEGEEAR